MTGRVVQVLAVVLLGLIITAALRVFAWPGASPALAGRVRVWWFRRLCEAMGLRIKVTGEISPGVLLVSNHVSWLDIPVLGAQAPVSFLSKAEVVHWPIVGWLARSAGTLFIARGANQVQTLMQEIEQRIQSGCSVVIFPEGTTTDGQRVGRFHPRLFAVAQREGVRVQPVALAYGVPGAPDPVAPFVGDDGLLPHLLRVLAQPSVLARVQFLTPIEGWGTDRRGLAELCHQRIVDAIFSVAITSEARSPDASPADPSSELRVGEVA